MKKMAQQIKEILNSFNIVCAIDEESENVFSFNFMDEHLPCTLYIMKDIERDEIYVEHIKANATDEEIFKGTERWEAAKFFVKNVMNLVLQRRMANEHLKTLKVKK